MATAPGSFPTEDGRCDVYTDRLELTRAATVSTVPVVARAAILRLVYHPARPGATRAYFVVLFRQGKRLRSRFILLPDPPGDEAAALALAGAARSGPGRGAGPTKAVSHQLK